MTIQSKKEEFGGATLAQISAMMGLAKVAFEASGMENDKVLNAKWGLVRKAWLAGCEKLPVSQVEIGVFSLAVLSFHEAVQAARGRLNISEMVLVEIAKFASTTRAYYLDAVPAVRDPYLMEDLKTKVEAPGLAMAPEVEVPPPQAAKVGPVTRDLPDPAELGPPVPLGGRATEPPAPSGSQAEPPPPDPGRIGGSKSQSAPVG